MLAEWYGDWASVMGLLVGVIGFVLTIYLLLKSKSATEAACDAVTLHSQQVRRTLALTDITSTIQVAEEIKRLHRTAEWQTALERYANLRCLLVRFREENPALTPEQHRHIQNAIIQTSSLETEIEEMLSTQAPDPDVVRWNSVLSRILEKLHAISVSLSLKGD